MKECVASGMAAKKFGGSFIRDAEEMRISV